MLGTLKNTHTHANLSLTRVVTLPVLEDQPGLLREEVDGVGDVVISKHQNISL